MGGVGVASEVWVVSIERAVVEVLLVDPNMAEAGFNRFGVGGRLTSSGGRVCLGGIAAACNNATIVATIIRFMFSLFELHEVCCGSQAWKTRFKY